jgi:hypothetical protein
MEHSPGPSQKMISFLASSDRGRSREINGYRFGPFRLDTRAKVLCRGDRIVNLKPKVVETLIVLVENHAAWWRKMSC